MSTETKLTALHGEPRALAPEKTVFKVLLAISFCHLLNDSVQSLLPGLYPVLARSFHLDYTHVSLIAVSSTLTASILQPLVGLYSDRHPKPYFLAAGMGITLIGLLTLSLAPTYGTVLVAAALAGMGSSVFHPESSRVARLASGGQHGTAQSLFQVGGNAGTALGPLLAKFVEPRGQRSIAWFSFIALLAMILLADIGAWAWRYKPARSNAPGQSGVTNAHTVLSTEHLYHPQLPRKTILASLAVLIALMFSKFFYLSSMTAYYTFYLMNKFHLSIQSAENHLFVFLAAVAAGTFFGGPVGDRVGRKLVIWYSILGVLPFTLLLPYANLLWTTILSVVIGLILASAFSTILVYAQELVPGRIGAVSGLFFGFAFGLGGIGAAVLGKLADWTSISFVYQVCSYLPAVGMLTVFLPNLGSASRKS